MGPITLPRMRGVRREKALTRRPGGTGPAPTPAGRGREGTVNAEAAEDRGGREAGRSDRDDRRVAPGDVGASAGRPLASGGRLAASRERDGRDPASRGLWLPSVVIAPLLLPLASAATRHWLVEAGATVCVAGGFIAAPFLTVTAWIGLALPRRMLLHQASTALFLVAILWMAAALIGAHLHHHRQPAHATGRPDKRE